MSNTSDVSEGVFVVFFFFFNNFFIYLWLHGTHCGTQAVSNCGEQGRLFVAGVRASHRGGFSCCRAWAVGTRVSVAAALELGTRCLQAPRSMGLVDVVPGLSCSAAQGILPDQGLNPSAAWAGGFLPTVPPGKSWHLCSLDGSVVRASR